MNKLEKRLYFFVPYNISPIQQAIQAGHAALEYAHKYKDDPEYIDFVENWKTWIILNGGTTNSQRDFDSVSLGSLNQIADQLLEKGVKFHYFKEPDLEDALTAVCFLCDEKVFNYTDYPDFHEWIINQDIIDEDQKLNSFLELRNKTPEKLKELFPGMYPLWVRQMGGEENLFLRQLLRNKKLA